MEFFEHNQICAWAESHGLGCDDRFKLRLPDLPSQCWHEYADGRRSGREKEAARDFISRLGPWDECLVSITLWGVWPSSEDWPAFYAWRGAQGELRSLQAAPGHRFDREEAHLLAQLIALIMENAWDADVLCSRDGHAGETRGVISHDEWYEVRGTPDAAG